MINTVIMLIILLTCLFVTIKCENDEPLILTMLIKNNKSDVARNLSTVIIPGFEDIDSHSGFITVDESSNSNLFFWFLKSEKQNSPVSVWLQGGPGGSSLIGLFYENGPLSAKNDSSLERRQFSWTKSMHMLYIDSPVGTGFSYTNNETSYTKTRMQYTEHLFTFMQQFFKLFPELRNNGLYLMGESYGCKPVASLAYKILTDKEESVNLKGLAIGGGFCDPLIQSKYSKLLKEVPQISEIQAKKLKKKETKMDHLVNLGEFRNATLV
ncbi:vitellogenic carboxypeptidase-like protein, partial [Leptotrombidium deliense]